MFIDPAKIETIQPPLGAKYLGPKLGYETKDGTRGTMNISFGTPA